MIDAQCNKSCGQNPNAVAGKGKGIVEEAQLQKHRRILEELHIHPADPPEHLLIAGRHQAEYNTKDQGQDQAKQRSFCRCAEALKEAGTIEPHLIPGSLRKNSCHFIASKVLFPKSESPGP